jgi:hypothetical protein
MDIDPRSWTHGGTGAEEQFSSCFKPPSSTRRSCSEQTTGVRESHASECGGWTRWAASRVSVRKAEIVLVWDVDVLEELMQSIISTAWCRVV